MHDGHNPQGPFVRSVGDKIIAYVRETQRTLGEVWTPIALVGEGCKLLNGSFNLFHYAVGGGNVALGDEIPNGVEVDLGFG